MVSEVSRPRCWLTYGRRHRAMNARLLLLVRLLKIRLAQDAHNIDPGPRPRKDDSIVARAQSIERIFEPVQLLNPFSVWNRIVGQPSAISEDLFGYPVGESIEVSLSV